MSPGPLPWETMDANDGPPADAEAPAEQAATPSPPETTQRRPGRSGQAQAEPPPHRQAQPEQVQTGDSRVDAALERLAELDDKPVGEHVAVVEDIHRALQDALAEDED